MRCRKVRSFLSAYSKDELNARRKVAVGEHLSNCADCREELQQIRAISQEVANTERMTVSDDFNARLLNRIAEERFAETRTEAHFPPKRAPWFRWERAVPAVATAAVVLLVAIFGGTGFLPIGTTAEQSMGQPQTASMFPVILDKDWSLRQQMDQIDRVNRISEQVTASPSNFSGNRTGVIRVTTTMVPYADSFVEVRRIEYRFAPATTSTAGEGQQVY